MVSRSALNWLRPNLGRGEAGGEDITLLHISVVQGSDVRMDPGYTDALVVNILLAVIWSL